jgi:integrase
MKAKQPGIRARHSRDCATRQDGRCTCAPSFEAWVWAKRDGRKIRKTFSGKGALAAAKLWRADAVSALNRGRLRVPIPITVKQAADELLAGMRDGTIPTRSGGRYKPSAVRGYERALKLRVLPALGDMRLGDVTRADVQDLVDRLVAAGLAASSIANTLDPLRVVYRRAVRRDLVTGNPTKGLELRRPDGRRDRIASPDEAARLLDALPDDDRALWATALYAGLRRGELRALRHSDINLDTRVIRVERGWDDNEGEQEGKSRAARRTVPLIGRLAPILAAHKLATGRDKADLLFGATADEAFTPSTVRRRALAAWGQAGLEPIGLHEARHTFASLMIAAGVNAKALSTIMGHATIAITFDTYGHLMPGGEAEARERIDGYLDRLDGGPRLRAVGGG